MADQAQRVENAIALGEFVESLHGKTVRVTQVISWRPGTGFERHSKVHSQFSMRVERTLCAMSGGHFMLFGQNETSYGIGTSKLFSVEISAGGAVIVERYGDEAERQSTLRVVFGIEV